jgi:AraC-like DNA-binding protein
VANLGARTAAVTPIGAYPLLDYLVVTADTVGDALEQLVRYFQLAAAVVRLRLADVNAAVRLVVEPGDDPFLAEYETALVLHHLRAETDQRLEVSVVSLMHEPDDVAALERLLACRVRTRAPWSGLEFPKAALHTPLRRRDPVLRGLLEGQAADVSSRAPVDGPPSLAATVRASLGARLPGKLSLSDVARQLGMAERTLQRRLAAEGASYGSVLDGVRREAAGRLLGSGSLTIPDVGYLLGFSEASAFHRAFRRWYAETPQEYRRRTMEAMSPRLG